MYIGAMRQSPTPKLKLFALVRDRDGRPKVDDPSTLPPEIVAALSPEDRAYLGLEEKT